MKNKNYLLLILFAFSFLFFSCTDDKDEIIPEEYLSLQEVTLKQTVNEKESISLQEATESFTLATKITFGDKPINWNTPTVELELSEMLEIDKNKVKIANQAGENIESADISIKDNILSIAFQKQSGSFEYLSGNTLSIDIATQLKQDLSTEQLESLKQTGIETKSIFYGETSANKIESNAIKIAYTPEEIKGDPRNNEYKYKLNVVYFVPSDTKINENYKERLSEMLLRHQLFTMKWMQHWGYGEKSFGLALDENGMVDIVLVNGAEKKAGYPYSSSISVPKMKGEIEKHYKENNLEFLSDHTLVITAVNEDILAGEKVDVPFYGYGRWCFALDFPNMSYDIYNIDPTTHETVNSKSLSTSYIGGLFHELGHGLNQPHIGATDSQDKDPKFGTTLMGSGNSTYAKKPTFIHPLSAAILNNCQVSSFVEKDFYKEANAKVVITDIIVNGDKCTVKGNFTSDVPVTEVAVRFYNATEVFSGGSTGYTSVGFVEKANGNNFEITIPIEELKIRSDFKFKVGATILMENGTSKNMTRHEIFKLEGNTLIPSALNDKGWNVTVSHPLAVDYAIGNTPNALVDGDPITCLSFVKPGKSYKGDDGVTVTMPADAKVYAIVDMIKKETFNNINLTFRSDNTNSFLRPQELSFYGSNDGENFVAIKEKNTLDVTQKTANIKLESAVEYRYLKMTYEKWDTKSGSSMQIAELSVENKKEEEKEPAK